MQWSNWLDTEPHNKYGRSTQANIYTWLCAAAQVYTGAKQHQGEKAGEQSFLQHLAARTQSKISLENASLVLNDGEAKGTQRSVEQKETPNYRKSRCYRLEMGKAELWLTLSH